MYSRNDIDRLAANLGFVRDNMEKVVRLCAILEFISSDAMLSDALVLKGGTAINLLLTELPRLSVDVDLDFTENCGRSTMLRRRKSITEKIHAFMFANGYRLMPQSKSPFSVDSWVFQYTNVAGNLDNIKIEINYSMRCHIMPLERRPILLPKYGHVEVLTLSVVELYATKTKALLERGAARDLFDVHNMIQNHIIDDAQKDLLRKGVVFYSAVGGNEKPNEEISFEAIERIQFRQIRTSLLPVLRKGTFYDLDSVKHDVVSYLNGLLQLTEKERLFIESFARNEYRPDLLFDDAEMVERIKEHPMAIWKTQQPPNFASGTCQIAKS